jgi:predicted metal-dependent TIM-barrel fold hydrolase
VLFDARLLARPLRAADLDDLRFFGVGGALVPTGDAAAPASADGLRAAWADLCGPTLRRLRRAGLLARAALGVHPRLIPSRGLEALLHELPDFLGRPGVAAIGEVGLDEGGAREERLLLRQLELAAHLRLPVVVHLPWRRRQAVTRRLLALLREAEVEPARVLVPADARTVRTVRACGHAALLSLSGGGGAAGALDEAVRLVRALGPEGLVLASGAGEAGGDLLALPRAAARLAKAGLSPAVVRRVCGENALQLLGEEPGALRSRA